MPGERHHPEEMKGKAKPPEKGRPERRPCSACHGSGQTSSFLGVSRFLLTWEECPECGGLGVVEAVSGGKDTSGCKR